MGKRRIDWSGLAKAEDLWLKHFFYPLVAGGLKEKHEAFLRRIAKEAKYDNKRRAKRGKALLRGYNGGN